MKKNKTIGIIGHFGKNKNFNDGQTVKTKEIYRYLKENNYDIKKYDTYKIYNKPLRILRYTFSALKNCDNVIIILSNRGYSIFMPIILFFNRFYKRKIFEFVIGGNRDKILEQKKRLLKLQSKITKIYVETKDMLKNYNNLGIYNVERIINFKYLEKQKIKKFKEKEVLEVCIFSRICEKKGIEDSIKAIADANKKLKSQKINLTIYGEIDSKYSEKFKELCNTYSEYITYKGVVNYNDSSKVLKDYDILLFLTYWDSEGMPGTLIDASYAALPTIATNWNHNKDFIKEDYNGKLVKVHDIKSVSKLLVYYYNNQKELYQMKKNCLEKTKDYNIEKSMEIFLKEL